MPLSTFLRNLIQGRVFEAPPQSNSLPDYSAINESAFREDIIEMFAPGDSHKYFPLAERDGAFCTLQFPREKAEELMRQMRERFERVSKMGRRSEEFYGLGSLIHLSGSGNDPYIVIEPEFFAANREDRDWKLRHSFFESCHIYLTQTAGITMPVNELDAHDGGHPGNIVYIDFATGRATPCTDLRDVKDAAEVFTGNSPERA